MIHGSLCRRLAAAACLSLLPLAAIAGPPGQPPLTPIETLGQALFFDKISEPGRMSCATCHAPRTGWTSPFAGINRHGAVVPGAIRQRTGNRKPPTVAYASFSPNFTLDAATGRARGGIFWDGRATGEVLGTAVADQASRPFLNHVEMNNDDETAVCRQVATAAYAPLFIAVWGTLDCASPAAARLAFERVARSIAAFEASPAVNPFASKFDRVVSGAASFTAEEARGRTLFEGAGQCTICHRLSATAEQPSLFTNFGFANIGTPRNPENPFYGMDDVFLDDGTAINPDGRAFVDLGLGGFLRTRADGAAFAAANDGRHRTPTLRNVDARPGPGFPKAYGHNGYFKSLKALVHFYNTRDVKPVCADPFTSERQALAAACWPQAEVPGTVFAAGNTGNDIGNLGLSDADEDAIVAFMRTLSDADSGR